MPNKNPNEFDLFRAGEILTYLRGKQVNLEGDLWQAGETFTLLDTAAINITMVGTQAAVVAACLSGIPLITISAQSLTTVDAQTGLPVFSVVGTQAGTIVAALNGVPLLSIDAQANLTGVGNNGTPAITVTAQCNATVDGNPGSLAIAALILGAIAAAVADTFPGISIITVLGDEGAVSVDGNAGIPLPLQTIIGTQGTATVDANSGIPLISVSSSADVSADGATGTPTFVVYGTQSNIDANAEDGTLVILKLILGIESEARIAAQAGIPQILVPGSQAFADILAQIGRPRHFNHIPTVELFAYFYSKYLGMLLERRLDGKEFVSKNGKLEDRELVGKTYPRWF